MNDAAYRLVDFQVRVPEGTAAPAPDDLAEIFGFAVHNIDYAKGVITVDEKHGIYRVGLNALGINQIRGRTGAVPHHDFYFPERKGMV